jgi:hypothetical protein
MLLVAVLAVVVAPSVAMAARPSISPAYVATYVGSDSEGRAVTFSLAGDEENPSGTRWFAYAIEGFRFHPVCSRSLITVPGPDSANSAHRIRVKQRLRFSYRFHGVTLRGYFYGPLFTPRVRGTVRVARPGCHEVLSFTARCTRGLPAGITYTG